MSSQVEREGVFGDEYKQGHEVSLNGSAHHAKVEGGERPQGKVAIQEDIVISERTRKSSRHEKGLYQADI